MKKMLVGAVTGLTALVAVPAAAGAASPPVITLLHGIPGATVDVFVNGTEVIPDFAPGATQDLSSFAGQTLSNIEVKLQDGSVAIAVPSLTVPSSGNWTVVAHLKADGTATLTPFKNNTDPVASGSGRLTVRHTAAAPAVDIVLGTARPVTNLANPNEQSLVLPGGTAISGAKIAPAGGDPIADIPSVTVPTAANLIVYAVGSLEGGTFTFLTQQVPLALPETGAGEVAAQVGIGSALALAGLGLVLAARRRPVAA